MVHCIALHCLICLKCKPIKKLGQTDQEISQPSKQGCFSRSQGPRVGPTCSHDLGIHLKCFGQGLDVQKSSVNAQSVRNPKSQLLVNCPFNQWFDDGNWFERSHSCPNSPHISCQTPSWKNLKPDQKFPKIETGPVISTAKNGNFLILNLHHDTSFKWIFAQHESWRSCSPISKKSKNTQFPCVVGKLWSNRFQKILNFKRPYLSNHLANFGGVFSYKSHLIPSFQICNPHAPKPHGSKWNFLTYLN